MHNKPVRASFLSPDTILWWAQVTVAPELNRIVVFNNGTENGSNGLIPKGGQLHPISTAGDKLLWKNAQKKEKNNKTSDTINRMNPIFKPWVALFVWWPWKVLSRTTSLHQKNKHVKTQINPKALRIMKL